MSSSTNYISEMPPITLMISEIKPTTASWKQALQLLYIIDGSCQITLTETSYHLQKHSIAFIRPMEIFTITNGNGTMAAILLDTDLIIRNCPGFKMPMLKSMLLSSEDKATFKNITAIIEDIIHTELMPNNQILPLNYMINSFRLMAVIIDCCSLENMRKNAEFMKNSPVLEAIGYTNMHFREHITIGDAAQIAKYSTAYFSKLFTQTTGMSYMKYLTHLRLQEAEILLKEGVSVGDIAKQCGFSDYRAFTRAYRQKNGITPSQRHQTNSHSNNYKGEKKNLNVLMENMNLLTSFKASLNTTETAPLRHEYIDFPDVSLNHFKQPPTDFEHTWQKTIGLGRASSLLHTQNQVHVRNLQAHLHYHRAIVHGLFDDDIQIVNIDERNNITFAFFAVKPVFDFLLSVNLEPVVELGYMPRVFAKNKTYNLNYGRSCSSMPESIEQWGQFIERFIEFLFLIYSREVVEKWEFCLWSKPDAYPLPFGVSNSNEYFRFYRRTYQAVKKMSNKIVFGSPAFIAYPLNEPWLDQFFGNCQKHNCLPDAIRFDFYPVNIPKADFSPRSNSAVQHLVNPEVMPETLIQIMDYCQSRSLPYKKPELEEWNFSISNCEYLNDTCYIASYIVKNALNCYTLSSDISYWAYNDYLGEAPLSSDTFYGGVGLCTYNGIKKPSYFAFDFLSRLGNQLIVRGEGYVVTKQEHDIQILFYNYCHYSVLYAKGENFNKSFSDRYDAFVDQKYLHYSILLTDLPSQRYLCTSHILNREHGSAFDKWIDMGMITIITPNELEYICGSSLPEMKVQIIFPSDGSYRLTKELKPFEVCLVELHPI